MKYGVFGKILGALNRFPGTVKAGDWALVEMHFHEGKISIVQIEKTQSSGPTKISAGYKSLKAVLELGRRL